MGESVMKLERDFLARLAAETGFRGEMLEKVAHLLNLLRAIRENDYLRTRLALKGGTALNLFHFALSRLSVDIDLNYVGAADRAARRHIAVSTAGARILKGAFGKERDPVRTSYR